MAIRLNKHGSPVAIPVHVRFWKYVEISDGCWIWNGSKYTNGYGMIGVRQKDGKFRPTGAHRVAYELMVGKIPEGKVLDHIICENPACVNPAHMIVVTQKQNVLRGRCPAAINKRKTHCKRGHAFSAENTYTWPKYSSNRCCKTCQKERYLQRVNPNL